MRELASRLIADGYLAGTGGQVDFRNTSRGEIVEMKTQGSGVRDLANGAFQIARHLEKNPAIKRGYLIVKMERVNPSRVRGEWKQFVEMLRPAIAQRMRLLAVVGNEVVAVPAKESESAVGKHVKAWARETNEEKRADVDRVKGVGASLRPTTALGSAWRQLEIEKVLVNRWLRNEGAIALGALAGQVGCSFPTAAQAIKRLTAAKLITRGKGRSVALANYRRQNWAEVARAQHLVYPPAVFVDPTRNPGAVDDVLSRLKRWGRENVAAGGVVAARHWDAQFDLNGTPRIDVVMHAADVAASEREALWRTREWVRQIDPGLKLREEDSQSPVLVVHQTYRRKSLFVRDEGAGTPWAPPVETILHLLDLGLAAQASDLLRRLRPEGRM